MTNKYNCAPGIDNNIYTKCFKHDQLALIIRYINEKYNKNYSNDMSYDDMIDIINNYIDCDKDNYICWIKSSFINNIMKYFISMGDKNKTKETLNIIKYTFRPTGPKNSLEWLSTIDINLVMNQYEKTYNNFLFLGATPCDFEEIDNHIKNINFDKLIESNKYILGHVINLDKHYLTGSHWVALYVNLLNNKIFFFDSSGRPPNKLIKKFITKIIIYFNKKSKQYKYLRNAKMIFDAYPKDKNLQYFYRYIKYNNVKHQKFDTECGIYSIHFLTSMLENMEDFDNYIKNRKPDNMMIKYRKIIFNE